ncbi:uncharacterized protein CCOS01_00867 [Colletotrichum costaricense]|uniref:Uncharacterized protein n=1 Tax=Colletotrichum costaricense TaxID=1209916 RepID=A0AAJ0E8E4_9PEZI|nr:uncharacterized protein CCOS01_00867 [Colletotrichum costaricense]KAK1539553.1 hypothetical protein CCOS01_00867 [Colletotrichum costaricense]
MSRMWRLAHSLMEEYVGAPVFGICCLKPKDPASLSSRIARHEEHYEQLQRRHHSILRAYFPSVVAGLPPSQRAVYPQLWYGVRRPRGDEMGWLSMDPSTPHERQPETQSMHALACFSSGTNVLVQLSIGLLLITNLLSSYSPSVRLTRCGTAGDACQGSSV